MDIQGFERVHEASEPHNAWEREPGLLEEIEKLREALRWCGGSQDFQPEGIAYEGWKKVMPLAYPDLQTLKTTT